jgi:hypothetical protein
MNQALYARMNNKRKMEKKKKKKRKKNKKLGELCKSRILSASFLP